MNILIVAPHPDDEILGCGGSIAKFSEEGDSVYIVVVSRGYLPYFSEKKVLVIRSQLQKAHNYLGVKETFYLDFPAAKIDTISHASLNKALLKIIQQIKPEKLYLPFIGDIHLDHQHTFLSGLVCSRPNSYTYPKEILAYETLSETNWNAPYLTPSFQPNTFVNIEKYLEKKMESFSFIQSECKDFPHERSLKSIQTLAHYRGSTVHCLAAEAFVLIRKLC